MTPPSKGGGTIMTLSTLALVSLVPSALAGNFWHISDLHLDYFYSKGGNVSNFCHKGNSEEEGTSGPKAGPAGDYNCDSPKTLVLSALQAMHKFQPKPDFIIWTGDSAPHWRDPAPPEEKYIMNVTKSVFRHLDSLFPGIPVVAALGNHDASPPDQFPIVPLGENKTDAYYTALWQQGAFGDHIQEDGRETFQRCGFYSKVLKLAEANLRMIVLNTNIYYSDNFTEGPDPCGQLEWLNTTLGEAAEPVFIVAHIPPGGFERGHGEEGMKININSPKEHAHDINQRFVQILTEQRNAKKIQGQLYGHLHTDTFRLFLDSATRGEARGVAFMASSVTPVVWGHINRTESGVLGTNPSVRLFTYSNSDFRLLDYSQYSLDLTEANKGDISRQSKKKELLEKQSKKKELLENVDNSRRRRDVDVVAPTETSSKEELSKDATSSNSSTIVSSNSSAIAETDDKSTPPPPTTVDPIATSPNNENTNVTSEISGGQETKEEDVNRLVTKWKLLYNATTAFNVTDLSPSSMLQAVKAMVTSGAKGSLFQAYYRHNTAGHPTDSCKEECWRDQLCTVTRLVEAELNSCLKAKGTEGFFYKSELLAPSPTVPLALPTTTPAPVTTSLVGEAENISRVTNDNDNLTLPPLGVTTSSPGVDIELEVSTSPPIRSDQPKVEPVPEDGGSMTTKAVSTVLGLLGMLVLCLLCALGYKKYRDSRYRNQEFLLTDSVFRYDGYSQLDDD